MERKGRSALAYEEPARRTAKKFNFWRGIYNKDKNYILGRTPNNWGISFHFEFMFDLFILKNKTRHDVL